MTKKKIDGVIVEAKSIITSLKIIKAVCEDNNCKTCPFAEVRNNNAIPVCLIKDNFPDKWKITCEAETWRALR